MNILSITAQKPHSTGSGTYLTELVRSWDRAGHRQAVVYGIYPEDTVDFPDGVACYPVFFTDTAADRKRSLKALGFPVVGMSDIMPYTSTRYCDLTPDMISDFEDAFIDAVGRAISDLDPDLIICHHLFLLTAMVRKHFPERRICGLSHGSDLRQAVSCPDLKEAVQPHIASLDHIYALHEEQADRISVLYGIPEQNISVIGTGYNGRLFNTDRRMPRSSLSSIMGNDVPVTISYAGKMSAAKGIPEFLEVLGMLSQDPDVPAFEVTLAGGCKEAPVMDLLEQLPDSIQWIGQIPQARLAEIFKFSDIFVLPSFYEGLPLVIIEAMACGAVPVCTDLPGVQEWIDSNVPDHNVRFVPMPEMQSVDVPTAAGRSRFVADLFRILRELITGISTGELTVHVPSTGTITWDAVAARIAGS